MKVVTAFIGPDNQSWQGAHVCVTDDGRWWTYEEADERWRPLTPPVPGCASASDWYFVPSKSKP